MITRIWHGATPAAKSDEYLSLMRTVALPDYRSTPGNNGAYALRRIEGDTAHFLMVRFGESEKEICAFCWRRHEPGEILRFREEFSAGARAVARCTTRCTALRDARQVNLTLLREKSKAA